MCFITACAHVGTCVCFAATELVGHNLSLHGTFAKTQYALWNSQDTICPFTGLLQLIDSPPEDIKYFYFEYQDTFAEIKSLVPNVQFIEGVSDAIFDSINPKTRNLYIFDDMMGERDSVIAKLLTKKSHLGNLTVIYIIQNLFHQSKDHCTISLNASYFVLTKNVRDSGQVIHLAKQMCPNNVKFFQQAYQMAEPFSYLFIDLTPTCPNETRLRSGIFPNDKHYVYVPRT